MVNSLDTAGKYKNVVAREHCSHTHMLTENGAYVCSDIDYPILNPGMT